MQGDYYLDPYLISVLFHVNTEEQIQDIQLDISIRQGFLVDLTLRKYLEEKGIAKEVIDKVMAEPEQVTEDVKQLLDSDEFAARIRTKINALMKVYYDKLLPRLSEQEKQHVDQYLAENKLLLESQKAAFQKGFQAMITILESAGVESYAELEKKDGYSQLASNYLTSLETNDTPSTTPDSKYSSTVEEYLKSLNS